MAPGARFALAAVLSAVGFVLTYVMLIRTAAGQEIENLALRGARQEFEDLKASSLAELQEISMAAFAIAIVLVMAVALLRRKPILAATTALVMGSSVVLAEVLKHFLPRPELVAAPPGWLNNSFPSGHVTVAVAIGIGAVLVAPYALRWLVAIGAALYAAGIGMDVATAGWHRLSGAIGATLLVLAVASIALLLMTRFDRVQRFDGRRLVGAITATLALGVVSLGLGGVGVVSGFGRLLPVPLEPTPSDQLLAYSSTLLTAAGVIALAFLAFLWLIRPYRIDEGVPSATEHPGTFAVTSTASTKERFSRSA
jgi:hypothetical protein